MTKITTLVDDIYSVLDKGVDSEKLHEALSESLPSLEAELKQRLSPDEIKSQDIRMSNAGQKCLRKLWYSKHQPDKAEPLLPNVRMTFLYGAVIEWVALLLTRLAGHKVTGEQTELEISGVKGHRDAIIDGHLVDIKSANSRSFDKFKRNAVKDDDPFGYMDQLNCYHQASSGELEDRQHASFLAVDKERGHIILDTYHMDTDRDFSKELTAKKEVIDDPDTIPDRGYDSVPFQKSGNTKLSVACSYCQFRKHCWPELRTFLYSSGPVHLVDVKVEPNVPEV